MANNIIGGLLNLGGAIVNGVSGHFERQDKIDMINIQGKIEKDLIDAKSNAEARMEGERRETIKAKGEIDIRKQEIKGQFDLKNKELDNIRANDKEKFDKDMKQMDYQFQKDIKTLDYEQEIRREEQKDKSKQVDAQIEIDRNSANAENQRKLITIEEEYKLKNKNADNQMTIDMRNLELKEKDMNQKHEQKTQEIANQFELNKEKLNQNAEDMRSTHLEKQKEIDNKFKLDMKDMDLKEKDSER